MQFDFNTLPDANSFVGSAVNYLANEVFPKAMEGDVSVIAMIGIAFIVLFIALILIVQLAAWVVGLIKRFFLFLLITVSMLFFFFSFKDKIFAEQPDLLLAVVGVLGLVFALIALTISVLSINRELQKPKKQKITELKKMMREAAAEEFEKEVEKSATVEATPAISPTQLRQPAMLSKQALLPRNILASFHDRSLLAVLSYMVVAEFGVFSGITVGAPNETVGVIFFTLFLIAALVFIKSTYHHYLTGMKHLFIALTFGFALSVLLGHIWIEIPVGELLSVAYFKTTSLVALITGLAVSLFLGTKA